MTLNIKKVIIFCEFSLLFILSGSFFFLIKYSRSAFEDRISRDVVTVSPVGDIKQLVEHKEVNSSTDINNMNGLSNATTQGISGIVPQETDSMSDSLAKKPLNKTDRASTHKLPTKTKQTEKYSQIDDILKSPIFNSYTVQIGAFENKDAIEKKLYSLKKFLDGLPVFRSQKILGDKTIYILQVGLFDDEKSAKSFCNKIYTKESVSCFVTRSSNV